MRKLPPEPSVEPHVRPRNVRGVRRNARWNRVRALALGPSVEHFTGPPNVRGVRRKGGGTACGPCHWGFRWT
eukprot:8130227-Pyramimonas_sp.AAC.1